MKVKLKVSCFILPVTILLIGVLFFSSCEKYIFEVEKVEPGEPVLFQTQIQPIFTRNCIICHKGSRSPDLRDSFSFASLTGGNYVTAPAVDSKLYKTVVSGSHTSFTIDNEKQLILLWIEQGALNN
jgi:hypothetical protein